MGVSEIASIRLVDLLWLVGAVREVVAALLRACRNTADAVNQQAWELRREMRCHNSSGSSSEYSETGNVMPHAMQLKNTLRHVKRSPTSPLHCLHCIADILQKMPPLYHHDFWGPSAGIFCLCMCLCMYKFDLAFVFMQNIKYTSVLLVVLLRDAVSTMFFSFPVVSMAGRYITC